VGPLPTYSHRREIQEVSSPRTRRCLLKDCEQPFRPADRWARYCSKPCRQDARQWSQWFANQSYRASERGKQQRRRQCQRNRQRRSLGPPEDAKQPPTRMPLLGCEGYQRDDSAENSPCHRPGCYECFPIPARSPLKKFCSTLCRRALRSVRQRESRWRRRLYADAGFAMSRSTRPP